MNNKYDTHIKPRLEEIVGWLSEGITRKQLCDRLRINIKTFYKYYNSEPEFRDAVLEGDTALIDQVERSIYKTALGYTYEEEEVWGEEINGELKKRVKKMKRYQAPNTTAQIFILTNRDRARWKHKQEIEHSGYVPVTIIDDIPKVDVDEHKS